MGRPCPVSQRGAVAAPDRAGGSASEAIYSSRGNSHTEIADFPELSLACLGPLNKVGVGRLRDAGVDVEVGGLARAWPLEPGLGLLPG